MPGNPIPHTKTRSVTPSVFTSMWQKDVICRLRYVYNSLPAMPCIQCLVCVVYVILHKHVNLYPQQGHSSKVDYVYYISAHNTLAYLRLCFSSCIVLGRYIRKLVLWLPCLPLNSLTRNSLCFLAVCKMSTQHSYSIRLTYVCYDLSLLQCLLVGVMYRVTENMYRSTAHLSARR